MVGWWFPAMRARPETGFSKPTPQVIIKSTLMSNQTPLNAGTTRRAFLKHSGLAIGAASLAGLTPSAGQAAESWPPASHELISKDDVILFQGDSITDAGRKKDSNAVPNDQPALGNPSVDLTSNPDFCRFDASVPVGDP